MALSGSSTVRLKWGEMSGRQPSITSRAVGLEGVGGVVEPDAEQEPEEEIGQPVDDQLDPGIINDPAALDEAAAEDAVPALVQLLPVADHVAAVVRFVGHHDHRRHRPCMLSSPQMMARPKPCRPVFWTGRSSGRRCLQVLQQLPGPVRAAVVHHDDLVGDALQAQLQVEMLDGRADAPLLIAGGNDDREQLERFSLGVFRWSCHPRNFQPVRMRLGMVRDLLENCGKRRLGLPAP